MLSRMRRILLPLAVGVGFAAVIGIMLQAPRASAQVDPFITPPQKSPTVPTPVVVELFTSEGCSSCPAADDLLADLLMQQPVEGARILALGIHVDYWNDLGWIDPFSSQQFTARQHAYANAFGSRRIYTPQMIVDGSVEFVGSNLSRALSAIEAAAAQPHLPVSIRVESSSPDAPTRGIRVRIEALDTLRTRDADVVLAVSESSLASEVSRGENSGRRLEHISVVRSLQRIGQIASDSNPDDPTAEFTTVIDLDPAWIAGRLSATVFVQLHDGQRIVGAAQTSLTPIAIPGSEARSPRNPL